MMRSLAGCLLLIVAVAPPAQTGVPAARSLRGGVEAQGAREQRIVTLLSDYAENWVAGKADGHPALLRVSNEVGGRPATSAYLRFPADALPNDATIDWVQLRLVRSGTQPINPELVMRIASIACTGAPPCNPAEYQPADRFAVLNVERRPVSLTSAAVGRFPQRSVDMSAWAPPAANPGLVRVAPGGARKYIALLLVPADSGSARAYYWAKPGDASADPSSIPRLIVTYSTAATAPPLTRLQADSSADVRSSRAFLPPAKVPRPPAYLLRAVTGENFTHAPAFYNGLLYLVQARNQERSLDAMTPLGDLVWSIKMPADLQKGTFVVVNSSGRLAILGPGRVLVTQLNAADAAKPPATPAPAPAELSKLLNNPSAVMAGPDGSLYVVNETSLYALNPDLRLLWRAGVGSSDKARMTLSPDGRFVYAAGIWNDKAALLAINAPTGRMKESPFPSGTRAFHAPVVVRHSGGADYVFVGANTGTTGVLRCVMNESTPQKPGVDDVGDTSALLKTCGSGWSEVAGLVGQPMLDSRIPGADEDLSGKRLFAVVGTKLTSMQPQNGTTLNTWDLPDLPSPTLRLWSGGSPVIDTDGNLLFWENGRLYGLSTAGGPSSTVFSQPVPGLSADTRLSFGPGGVLYASGVSDYQVRALLPRYQLPIAAGISEISSPTYLQIDGATGEQRRWVLTAEDSVIVGSGFTVERDAALSITSRGVVFRPGFTVRQGAALTVTTKPR